MIRKKVSANKNYRKFFFCQNLFHIISTHQCHLYMYIKKLCWYLLKRPFSIFFLEYHCAENETACDNSGNNVLSETEVDKLVSHSKTRRCCIDTYFETFKIRMVFDLCFVYYSNKKRKCCHFNRKRLAENHKD